MLCARRIAQLTLFTSLFAVACVGRTARAASSTATDATCSTAAVADPDEFPSRFTSASIPYATKCLETNRFRSVRNLKVGAATIAFDNFRYRGQFWKAEMPGAAEAYQDVLFHIKKFEAAKGVTAAHTQIRIRMKPGFVIWLVNQTTGEKATADDLLVSYEAGLPRGVNYNFAVGAIDAYAIIGRAGDAHSISDEAKRPVEQYLTNLSPEEALLLAKNHLAYSQELGQSGFYNTLSPNCTTVAFDLLDKTLRASRGANPPRFLTELSLDPVSGPSLRALASRGILAARIQNMEDEPTSGVRSADRRLELPPPSPPGLDLPYAAAVAGKPWTLIVAKAEGEQGNKTFEAIRTSLARGAFKSVNGLSAMRSFTGDANASRSDFARAALANAVSEVRDELRRIDAELPEANQTFAIYLEPAAPVAGQSPYANLEILGAPAAIPVPLRLTEIAGGGRTAEPWTTIRSGLYAALAAGPKADEPAYLAGVALVINAAKGRSTIAAYAAFGLAPSDKPFPQESAQVKIERIATPPIAGSGRGPAVLLSYKQFVFDEPSREVLIDFGPPAGIHGARVDERGAAWLGGLDPSDANGDCENLRETHPRLDGTFSSKATGTLFDSALVGKPVSFFPLSAALDLSTGLLSELRMSVAPWPLTENCFASIAIVDAEFKAKANEALAAAKSRLQSQASPLVETLRGILGEAESR